MKEQNNWFSFAEEDIRMAKAAFKEKIFNQVCFHYRIIKDMHRYR